MGEYQDLGLQCCMKSDKGRHVGRYVCAGNDGEVGAGICGGVDLNDVTMRNMEDGEMKKIRDSYRHSLRIFCAFLRSWKYSLDSW